MSRSRAAGNPSTTTTTNRDTKQQTANNRKEKSEPICGWESCQLAWEECDIVAWDQKRQLDSEIKADLAKRAFKEPTNEWSDFVCSLGCRCPEIIDIQAFVENSLSERLKPRVKRKSQTQPPEKQLTENGPRVGGPVQSRIPPNDPVPKGSARKTDGNQNKPTHGAGGVQKVQEAKSYIRPAPEGRRPPLAVSKRTSPSLTLARERPATRALLNRRSISLGNIQIHDENQETLAQASRIERLPSSTDERAQTPEDAKTRSSSRASVNQLREIADKIIFEDEDFLTNQNASVNVGHLRRNTITSRQTPVKFHYTRSNISLNNPNGATTSPKTSRPHAYATSKEKECFVTSLRKFHSEPNIESVLDDGGAVSRHPNVRDMAVVSVTPSQHPKDALAHLHGYNTPSCGKDAEDTSVVLKTSSSDTKGQVSTTDQLAKGKQQAAGGSGNCVNGAADQRSNLTVNQTIAENAPEGDDLFLSTYFRERSASTFFPIADLLPAVDHSIQASYAQSRARASGAEVEVPTTTTTTTATPTAAMEDSYVTWSERELVGHSKGSLLPYEERLIMIREGVDLDRLKERNQSFLGPPAFRPHQNRTPLHRARESAAKRMHGPLHFLNGQAGGDHEEASRSRWQSANGQMYNIHRGATGSVSARMANESAEKAKRHDIISRSADRIQHLTHPSLCYTARTLTLSPNTSLLGKAVSTNRPRKSHSAGSKPPIPAEGHTPTHSTKRTSAPSNGCSTALLLPNGDITYDKPPRSQSAVRAIVTLSRKNREASSPASTQNANNTNRRTKSAGRLFSPYRQTVTYTKVRDILKI